MANNFSFPEQYYVGVKSRSPFDLEDPKLAFATPYGTDSAFTKRRSTVDQWVGNPYEHLRDEKGEVLRDERGYPRGKYKFEGVYEGNIIDNVPLEGFSFEKAVSRWSTSNKWFTINDPRGFQLQISADNLADILIHGGVSKGDLVGAYIWARNGQNNFLCRTDHPEYQRHLAPSVARPQGDLKPGDVVRLSSIDGEHLYLGTYYLYEFGIVRRYIQNGVLKTYDELDKTYNYYRSSWNYSTVSCTLARKDLKVFHVFRSIDATKYAYMKDRLHIFRGKPKHVILRENEPFPDLENIPYYMDGVNYSDTSNYIPFKTKKELVDYELPSDFDYFEETQKIYPYKRQGEEKERPVIHSHLEN